MERAALARETPRALEAARAVAAFLASETGLSFQPPSWDASQRAAIVGFDSVAGRHHRVAFSEEFLTELSREEMQEVLRAYWLPGHLVHPAYQPLLVTSEGLTDYRPEPRED
jgi:hypothetical protein